MPAAKYKNEMKKEKRRQVIDYCTYLISMIRTGFEIRRA